MHYKSTLAYIPEHQNKLNIYDLQNYEFFCVFFNRKKS